MFIHVLLQCVQGRRGQKMSGDICWCIVGELTSDQWPPEQWQWHWADTGTTCPTFQADTGDRIWGTDMFIVYGDEGCMEYNIQQSCNVKCFNTGKNNCIGSISIVSLSIVKIVPVGMLYRLSWSVSPLIFDHPILETDWMIEVNWQYATEYGRGRGTPDTRGI